MSSVCVYYLVRVTVLGFCSYAFVLSGYCFVLLGGKKAVELSTCAVRSYPRVMISLALCFVVCVG